MGLRDPILAELGRGGVRVFSPGDFLHLGSELQAHRALRALAKDGEIMLIGRGLYTTVLKGRFGAHAPPTTELLAALERNKGIAIVPSGAAEANALGLTTQVPIREVFLTSGRGCRLQCGKRSIDLLSARPWLLEKAEAGRAIRALYWIGKEQAHLAASDLKRKMPKQDWEGLEQAIPDLRQAPTWLASAIKGARP
jgi:Family of unknown function (DUF6088)